MDTESGILILLLAAFIAIYFLKMTSDLFASPSVSMKFILAAMFWPVATVVSLFYSLSEKLKKKGGDEELP